MKARTYHSRNRFFQMNKNLRSGRLIIVVKTVVAFASAIRLLPHIVLLMFSSRQGLLHADLDRYADNHDGKRPRTSIKRVILFVKMMTFVKEYRNVFYLRHTTLSRCLALLCPPMKSLTIRATTCGPGLFIHHGNGTSVSAAEIGAHCSIGRLVTIGNDIDPVNRPKIGNHVTIATGASVLGALTIGDNSFVSANSLVVADIPPGVTVIGVPGRLIFSQLRN
jgi:serine O-acetyltransferase